MKMSNFLDSFDFTYNGDIIINETDNPELIIDALIEDDQYENIERGIGFTFSPEFISKLMYSGFYITSDILNKDTLWFDEDDDEENFDFYPLLNIWSIQTVLFFDNLHISKSINRLLNKYEFKINHDFENVIDCITDYHGSRWITAPLKETLLELNKKNYSAKAISFEVYRNGKLRAGEIGIVTGKIYTSYSGFYNEPSAGSVQLALMLKYLKNNNFHFCNFGTDDSEKNNIYKQKFGSVYIRRADFIELWRKGRE